MQNKRPLSTKFHRGRKLEIATPNELTPWHTEPAEFEEVWTVSNHQPLTETNPRNSQRINTSSSLANLESVKPTPPIIEPNSTKSAVPKSRERIRTRSGTRDSMSTATKTEISRSTLGEISRSSQSEISRSIQTEPNVAETHGLKSLNQDEKPIETLSPRKPVKIKERRQLSLEMLAEKPDLEGQSRKGSDAQHSAKNTEAVKMSYFNSTNFNPPQRPENSRLASLYLRQRANDANLDPNPKASLENNKSNLLAGLQNMQSPQNSKLQDSVSQKKVSVMTSEELLKVFDQYRTKPNSGPFFNPKMDANLPRALSRGSSLTSINEFNSSTKECYKQSGVVYNKIQIEKMLNKALQAMGGPSSPGSKGSINSLNTSDEQRSSRETIANLRPRRLVLGAQHSLGLRKESEQRNNNTKKHRMLKVSSDMEKVSRLTTGGLFEPIRINFRNNSTRALLEEKRNAMTDALKSPKLRGETGNAGNTEIIHTPQKVKEKGEVSGTVQQNVKSSGEKKPNQEAKIRNLFASLTESRKTFGKPASQIKLSQLLE